MRDHQQQPLAPGDAQSGTGTKARAGAPSRYDQYSLDDPETYALFVRGLYKKIENKLTRPLDEEIQIEIAGLMRLLSTMRRSVVSDQRVSFELAFDLLAADEPNLVLIRSIRYDLLTVEDRYAGGLVWLIVKMSGNTPLSTVISALATVFLLSFILLYLMGHVHLAVVNSSFMDQFPSFSSFKNVPIGEYLVAVHAAFLGSIVSIIIRVKKFVNTPTFSAVLIYFCVLTKPFIAAMFAILAYTVMKAGLVSFLGVDVHSTTTPYVAWTVGFLSGFSERLAQDFVVRAGGTLGESPPTGSRQQK